jgi:hypothetical protein
MGSEKLPEKPGLTHANLQKVLNQINGQVEQNGTGSKTLPLIGDRQNDKDEAVGQTNGEGTDGH